MNELPMPLLDIAIAQPFFQSHRGYARLQLGITGKATNYSLLQYEERWVSFWNFSQNRRKMSIHPGHHKKLHPRILVKAVATFEPRFLVQSEDGGKESNASPSNVESVSSTFHIESSDADSKEIDAKEKLRRMRISKANKGNTPWNKGRKHSPETLQRIRERTKLAMQNPKVRMKLASIGHAQSQETKDKIGAGVRMGWKKRRQRLAIQESCLFDWENLIAEAARKGFEEEEELQWDSYEILKRNFEQEWLDSIEYRKTMPRPKSNKRAPKSLEQRRKIAEAIAAKWADPEYRARVCSGLAKYHGTPEAAERKVKRKPSGEGQVRRTPKKKISDAERSTVNELKANSQQPKLEKRYVPKYKDPLATSKLEMLKSIRAQRVASLAKKNETLERAKILIAEAEKAAKALEAAAMRSPVAQASLTEARKLIAEATQTIEKIENGDIGPLHDAASRYHQNHVEKNGNTALSKYPIEEYPNGIIGFASLQSGQGQNPDSNLYRMTMLDKMVTNNDLPKRLGEYEFPGFENDKLTAEFGALQGKLRGDSDVSNLTPINEETVCEKVNKEFERGDAINMLSLRALMDQCYHHPEPNGFTRLNGSFAVNGTNMHIHDESPASNTVMKKWVRGRLVKVVECE